MRDTGNTYKYTLNCPYARSIRIKLLQIDSKQRTRAPLVLILVPLASRAMCLISTLGMPAVGLIPAAIPNVPPSWRDCYATMRAWPSISHIYICVGSDALALGSVMINPGAGRLTAAGESGADIRQHSTHIRSLVCAVACGERLHILPRCFVCLLYFDRNAKCCGLVDKVLAQRRRHIETNACVRFRVFFVCVSVCVCCTCSCTASRLAHGRND